MTSTWTLKENSTGELEVTVEGEVMMTKKREQIKKHRKKH